MTGAGAWPPRLRRRDRLADAGAGCIGARANGAAWARSGTSVRKNRPDIRNVISDTTIASAPGETTAPTPATGAASGISVVPAMAV